MKDFLLFDVNNSSFLLLQAYEQFPRISLQIPFAWMEKQFIARRRMFI